MTSDTNEENAQAALISHAQEMLAAGQWSAALRLLRRLLQHGPADARVWALIGDCYAAGGRWRQAAAAYERSLDIAYDAEITRRLQEAREQAAAHWALTGSSRMLSLSVAAVLLAALAVALILSLSGQGSRRQRSRAPSISAGAPVAFGRRPAVPAQPIARPPQPTVQPPSELRPPAQSPVPPQNRQPQAPPVVPPPVVVTRRVQAPASDKDCYLTDIVGSLSWPDGTPLSGDCLVQFDPALGHAFVTVTVPRSLRAANLVVAATQIAQHVAWALFNADEEMKHVTVRVLYAIEEPGRRTRTVVAFRATIRRDAYEYWRRLGRQPTVDELWHTAFVMPWWNPEVPVQPQASATETAER